MNTTFEIGELDKIGEIVARPGYGILQSRIAAQAAGENNLVARITGRPFEDGKACGRAEAWAEVSRLFANIKKEVEKIPKEDK